MNAFILVALFAPLAILAQLYNTNPSMGGSVGCVVTGKKLYSHGNYIRDLTDQEQKNLKKYKADLALFKKKIDEAFANAGKIENANSTIPPMPVRPVMPSFCTGPDTTLYILPGCTVQNNKVYIGKEFARNLTDQEKKQLALFAKQMAGGAADAAVSTTKDGVTTTTVTPTSGEASGQVTLDFCTEF
uniref:Pepsin-I3 domain-containing protein n=1 Tax=Steinernema glaseri TaxID=37863 RepID=A0A1I8AD94_9BILA